jgi:exosome complex component MTR3
MRQYRLANCYTPLALPKDAKEVRDRPSHGLRQIVLETGVVSSSTGSALVELGHTKVLCRVTGPISDENISAEEGTLQCVVKYAQFAYPTAERAASVVSSLDNHTSRIGSWVMTQEADLSARLSAALAAVLPLHQYAQLLLKVEVTILQDDGCVLPASITAASLALTDAAFEMYDLITCCTVAIQDTNLLADPSTQEIQTADATMTMAMLPNWKEATLWEQTGRLTPDQANKAMDMCRDGCRTMHKFMREHLLTRKIKEEP